MPAPVPTQKQEADPAPGTKRVREEEAKEATPDSNGRSTDGRFKTTKRNKTETATTEADADTDAVESLLSHDGPIDDSMKSKLLDRVIADKRRTQELETELSAMREKLKATEDTSKGMQAQFTETLMPILKRFLPANSMTPERENQLTTAASDAGAQKFLQAWAMPLVQVIQASASAVSQEQQDPQRIELNRRIQMYRALTNGAQPVAAPVANPIHSIMGHTYGWMPAQAPAQVAVPMTVQASAPAAPIPVAAPPAAPTYQLDPEIVAMMKNDASGDAFPWKDVQKACK
ncbi:MAG: hypothetical protein JKY23_05220 [Nitrospinaceae bacterium]|nr:hypothetical protein [Nitrospinaceae bacterium]